MTHAAQGALAYQKASGYRSAREQEADVFRRATGALRVAMEGGRMAQVRAVADNRRLWQAVTDLMTDPSNALPMDIRAGLISLGIAVRREMDRPDPNLSFLIGINENIIAGLVGEI
jgi:flagellar biosynthesis regulator FlaF